MHKIKNRVLLDDIEVEVTRDWQKLEQAVLQNKKLSQKDKEIAISHASNVLGRSFLKYWIFMTVLQQLKNQTGFLHAIYWLGKTSYRRSC